MKNIKNHNDLEVERLKRINKHYAISNNPNTVVKDVDFSKRIVQAIPNTFLYFDHDQDVLMPGSCSKTIQERGPKGNGAKIKNVKDHTISNRIGKVLTLDERSNDNKKVLYGEARMLDTTMGNDMLIEYQENMIDQHSIGYRYIDLSLVSADDGEEWSKLMAMIINPDDAEEYGYAFVVKEIELFEYSPVSFGANELTPYLGVKSGNKDSLKLKLFDRFDLLNKQLRHGKQSDETMRDYELETRQIKQIISELFSGDSMPSIKDTLIEQSRHNKKDTSKSMRICPACMKQFDDANQSVTHCPGCGQFVAASAMPVNFDINKAIKETTFSKFFN